MTLDTLVASADPAHDHARGHEATQSIGQRTRLANAFGQGHSTYQSSGLPHELGRVVIERRYTAY